MRCAPSFVAGASCNPGLHPYTATTVAQFLGMTSGATPTTNGKERVQPALVITVALDALELIEQGALTEDAAIDPTSHEELGPKVLAQKIQAKHEATKAAFAYTSDFCPVSSIRTNLKFLFDNAAFFI